MSKYSAEGATKETGSKFLDAGITVVKTKSIELGTSKALQPKITITVEDNTNATATNVYSLSQIVGEGKTKAAWDITKNAILQLLMAVMTEDKARETMKADSDEQFVSKLSAALVGKAFRIKLDGEEILTAAGNKFIKAKFGTGNFAESVTVTDSKLRFDATKNIKRLPAEPTHSTNGTATTTTNVW